MELSPTREKRDKDRKSSKRKKEKSNRERSSSTTRDQKLKSLKNNNGQRVSFIDPKDVTAALGFHVPHKGDNAGSFVLSQPNLNSSQISNNNNESGAGGDSSARRGTKPKKDKSGKKAVHFKE